MAHNPQLCSLSPFQVSDSRRDHFIVPTWFRIFSTPGPMSHEQESIDITTRDPLQCMKPGDWHRADRHSSQCCVLLLQQLLLSQLLPLLLQLLLLLLHLLLLLLANHGSTSSRISETPYSRHNKNPHPTCHARLGIVIIAPCDTKRTKITLKDI